MKIQVNYFDEARYLSYTSHEMNTLAGIIEITAKDFNWNHFYRKEIKEFERFEKFDSFTCGSDITYWRTENDYIIQETFGGDTQYYSARSMIYHSMKYGDFKMNERLVRQIKLDDILRDQ